jgi:hypothetical protein
VLTLVMPRLYPFGAGTKRHGVEPPGA